MISIQVKGFSRRDVPSFGKQKPKIWEISGWLPGSR